MICPLGVVIWCNSLVWDPTLCLTVVGDTLWRRVRQLSLVFKPYLAVIEGQGVVGGTVTLLPILVFAEV